MAARINNQAMEIGRLARLIYEATRVEAEWSGRPIVPETWDQRGEEFRQQFVSVVAEYIESERLPTPKPITPGWNPTLRWVDCTVKSETPSPEPTLTLCRLTNYLEMRRTKMLYFWCLSGWQGKLRNYDSGARHQRDGGVMSLAD
jgi:hypothetical protein